MKWREVQNRYPNQWLIVETLEAYTTSDHRRILESIIVLECCSDGQNAFNRYQQLHKQYSERELYFVHTSRDELDIRERSWIGIRR